MGGQSLHGIIDSAQTIAADAVDIILIHTVSQGNHHIEDRATVGGSRIGHIEGRGLGTPGDYAQILQHRAVQIFGGRGYMRENVAERFFRELRVDRIWEGTSEIQRMIIARGLIKRGLDEL